MSEKSKKKSLTSRGRSYLRKTENWGGGGGGVDPLFNENMTLIQYLDFRLCLGTNNQIWLQT